MEGLFTAFNEGATSAATNQSSTFLHVTQRLHQTTRTADQAHDNPFLLPGMRDKGLPSPSVLQEAFPGSSGLPLLHIHRAACPV